MIKSLPWYLPTAVICICTYFFLFWIITTYVTLRRQNKGYVARKVAILGFVILSWLVLQAMLAYRGFYLNFESTVPRFLYALSPPVVALAGLFVYVIKRKILAGVPLGAITYLSAIRFPVEIILWILFLNQGIPRIMTFLGANFDILIGLTAPVVAYLCFTKKVLSVRIALIWHCTAFLFLANVSILFILSVPSSFQLFEGENAYVALLSFPFIWVPSFGVPSTFFSHVVAIERLWKMCKAKTR